VPEDRWIAMLRLDHNRTRAQLAQHVGVPLESVARVSVWGNHSPTMVPDVWHATINGEPATELVDEAWITSALIPLVQERGAQLIEVSGASSAASAASALGDSIRDLISGAPAEDWTTAAVVSHGEYDIPEGLQFGFPVTMNDGGPAIVEGLDIGAAHRALLDRTVAELAEERDLALQLLT
jgi:malate dehydrogenase